MSASMSKRVTYALAGAGLAVMALPLVSTVLPGSAGATRVVPGQATSTSIGITTVVPTDPTVAKSTLVMVVSGTQTVQTFNPGTSTYTVSTGICTVEVIVSGGAGGNVGGTAAGRGAQIRGQFAVAAGEKFDMIVGAYRGGGTGGLTELNGGGATRIVKQSNAALVVEAAGGGGDALAVITRTNASSDTIPGATTLPGGTAAPFIRVNVVPGKGADAPASTAVTPVTAAVQVPIGNVPGSSTTLVSKSASAVANGSNTAAVEGVLSQDVAVSSTAVLARSRVDVYRGGAGGGGAANPGGAAADGGSAGSIVYNVPASGSAGAADQTFSAPFAVGAAVGGSGGANTIGNGFLVLANGTNDTGGSTLPPLGGGQGSNGPLVPAALALIGAGVGMLVVRRRSAAAPAEQA
jgi:hypothetical protein